MPDLVSRLDLYGIGRDYLLQRATAIDPNKVDTVGSDANLFVGSQSVVGSAVVRQLAYKINALLLTGATGPDLDRLGYDRYQEPRKGASPALGSVRFYRPTAAAGAGSVPVGTTIQTGTAINYITTTLATFGASQVDNATASVRASQAGKASQVGANQIVRIPGASALFDPTLQVNNDLATAGGEDAEIDDDYRNRLLNFWLTARRGTLGAIVQGALATPGVVSASATEVINGIGQPARIVILYIADSSGVASAELAAQVQVVLDDYRAAGIAVVIVPGIPQLVSIVLSLTFAATASTQTVSTNVQAAVVNFVNSLPVNGPLQLLQLGAVLQRFASQGLIPNASSIVSPVGDLVPALGSTLRTLPNLVTVAQAA
jgi:uncharacterized phage protein gp47/JayE